MIQDALNISTRFELNNDPKNFKFTDTTDYTAEGIALTDVVGIFTVLGPDNSIVYQNTNYGSPDIDADSSLVFDTVSLPLDSESNVQLGDYKVTYSIQVGGAVQPGTYSKEFNYNNQHATPTVAIIWDVDVKCSKITATDNTSYGSYVDTVTRTFTLRPPAFSGLTDTVTTAAVVSQTPITDKTWAAEVSSVVDYTYADGLLVTDLVEGSDETEVTADSSLCDIYCGLDALVTRYNSARTSNPSEAERIKNEQIVPVLAYIELWVQADNCGKDNDKTKYYNLILDTAQIHEGCSCDGDSPTLIIPTCGAGGGSNAITVVDVCGNGAITVSANTVGDTTTYTLCFDDDKLALLNAAENATVTAGTNITVTPTVTAATATTPKSTQYAVSAPGLISESNATLTGRYEYDIENDTFTTISEDIVDSSIFQTPTFQLGTAYSVGSDVKLNFVDWHTSGSVDTTVLLTLDEVVGEGQPLNNAPVLLYKDVDYVGNDYTSVSFKFWNIASGGYVVYKNSGFTSTDLRKVRFSLTLIAKQ